MISAGSDPQIAIIEAYNAKKRTTESKPQRQAPKKRRLNVAGFEKDMDHVRDRDEGVAPTRI